MFWSSNIFSDPRAGVWYHRLRSRPGWVWQAAILSAVLVVVLPLVLLTLAAVVVAAAVFTVLSLVVTGVNAVRRALGLGRPRQGKTVMYDDGRRNVRVVKREW